MKSLFTFILEFRGGTYTTQVESINLHDSIDKWTVKIKEEQEQIYQIGTKTIEEIKEQIDSKESDKQPVLLNGLKNVWYFTISTKQGFGNVHIIKTEKHRAQ
ncbi:MAG: hypothetical protein N4A45_09470 [Flavobacteriales bacterium]|jgi:hypothetical protein|nr:hypothetical protein [Flavobacteriales bacterium]